jgi:hypothetical protein
MPNVKPTALASRRPLLAELMGTALLVTVVVGSGIAAARLSPTDGGLQLLENSTATVFGLAVLILMFWTGLRRPLQPSDIGGCSAADQAMDCPPLVSPRMRRRS